MVTISTLCLLDVDSCRTADYVADMVEQAAQRQQHDLIVAPLTPFLSFREGHEAEDLARAYKTYIAVAMMEAAEDGQTFCTSVLLGREGQVAGRYRKTHALPDDTMALGDDLPVFETDFGMLGLSLGTDFYFPEVYAVERMKGAEIILDPSQHWGADGYNNELMLRARAVDNGCWVACAHWNSSDPGLRSLIVDPYGYVMAASHFQEEGAVFVDVNFDRQKVYYAGRKAQQPTRGEQGISSYYTEDIPEQRPGWREMVFARRRPELYGILPTVNEVIMKYRPPETPEE